MPTHPIYDMLLTQVSEDLERKVLGVLLDRAGLPVTRPELVQAVFGYRPTELAGNTDDRKIREAIENLQAHEYPIVASSGAAGYTLSADENALDTYLAEIGSRISTLTSKRESLQKSRRWIAFIRQWRERPPVMQERLF